MEDCEVLLFDHESATAVDCCWLLAEEVFGAMNESRPQWWSLDDSHVEEALLDAKENGALQTYYCDIYDVHLYKRTSSSHFKLILLL